MVVLTELVSSIYIDSLTWMSPPHIENLEVKSVNIVNLTQIVFEVHNIGNCEATITQIFVEGVDVCKEGKKLERIGRFPLH